jgi:hypothetical protein
LLFFGFLKKNKEGEEEEEVSKAEIIKFVINIILIATT